MADIARLGFDIDTAALQRASGELRTFATNANQAGVAVSQASARITAGMNAIASAAQSSGQAATNAAQQIANAQTAAAQATNAAATAQRNAAAATTQATQATNAGASATRQAANSNNVLAATLNLVRAGYATLAGIILGRVVTAITQAMDVSIQFANSLYLAGVSGDALSKTMDDLYNIANKTGQGINDIQLLYRRASVAGKDLGLTQDQIKYTVEGVASALKIQGTSARQAQGVLLQFTQAMGSGTVRAEEFNSIMEGALPIAQAAARGWKGGAISVQELRNKMLAGTVTSKEFVSALERGFGVTIAQAKEMGFTIEQSVTIMHNGFVRLIGSIDMITGASSGLASALAWVGLQMSSLAKWFDSLTEVEIQQFITNAGAAFVVFGTIITAVCIPAIIAFGATVVSTLAAIAVAILANPIGLLVTAVVAVVVAMYYFRDEVKAVLQFIANMFSIQFAIIGNVLTAANQWIKDTFGIDIFASLKEALDSAVAWIKDTFGIDVVQIFDDFMAYLDNIFGSGDIVEIFRKMANEIIRSFNYLWIQIKFVWNNFPDLASAAWDAILSITADAVNWLVPKFIEWFNSAAKAVTNLWNNFYTILTGIVGNIGSFIAETFQNFITWSGKKVVEFADKIMYVWNNFPEIMGNILTSVTELLTKAFNSVVAWAEKKMEQVINAAKRVKDWIVNLWNTEAEPPQITPPKGPIMDKPAGDPARDARLAAEAARKANEEAMNRNRAYIEEQGAAYEKATPKVNKHTDAVTKNTGAQEKSKKGLDPWTKLVNDAEQYIIKQTLLEQQLGHTALETAILKKQEELRAKAQDANIKMDEKKIATLKRLGEEQGRADAKLAASKFVYDAKKAGQEAIDNANIVVATAGMSEEATLRYKKAEELLNNARREGHVLMPQQVKDLQDVAAATAAAEVKSKEYAENIKFMKDLTKDTIKDLINAVRTGASVWDVFAKAAEKALDRIIDKIAQMATDALWDQIMGATKNAASGAADRASGKGGSSGGGGTGGGSGFGDISIDKLGDKLSGAWSETTDFFKNSTLFGGPTVTATPAGGFSNVGDLISSGQTGATVEAGGSAAGGIAGSGISAIGAVGAGIGVIGGAMQLMNSKGTGDTIKGIGTMVGAIVSLIPGIGQIAGPIIMIASQILGSLIGNAAPEPITDQAYGQLTMGAGGWSTSGGAWGPNAKMEALTGPLAGVGKTVDTVFKAFGGVKDPSKVWGMALESISKGGVPGWDFKSVSSFLQAPGGGEKIPWRMNEDNMMDTGAVQVAVRSILGGAVGEISINMRKVLEDISHASDATVEVLAKSIEEIMQFDAQIALFGKDMNEAEKQILQVAASFNDMYAMAAKYGLAAETIAKIDKERLRMMLKATEAFTDGVAQTYLELTNPLQAKLNALDKAFASDKETNATYLRMVEGYQDQSLTLEAIYQINRQKIIDDANAEAIAAEKERIEKIKRIVESLDELIKRFLPGGGLAGESAAAHIAGLRTTYEASRAQAMASPQDETVIATYLEATQEFADAAKDFYADDLRYQALRNQFIADAQAIQAAAGGPVTTGAVNDNTASAAALDSQFQQLMGTVKDLTIQLAASEANSAKLQALLSRYLVNG